MFDLTQTFSRGLVVEAHDKKWVTLYLVSSDDAHKYYLASEADAPLPAEVRLIQVSKAWEQAEFQRQLEALKASKPPTTP